MTEQSIPYESPEIEVGDLSEPPPLPPELDEAIAADEAAPPPEDAAAEDRRAGLLARALGKLFQLAGIGAAFGLPSAVKQSVRAVWAIDPREAGEIAEGLLPLVPEGWLRSRTLRHLGVAGGLIILAGAVVDRAERTRAIRKEVIRGNARTPAPAAGEGGAGGRSGGPHPALAQRPDAGRTPEAPDGYSGAGLGPFGVDDR